MDGLTRLIIAIAVFGGVLLLMFHVSHGSSDSAAEGPIGPGDGGRTDDGG
ncbi:hypothetical protein ACFQ3B_12875 [Stackebrandtia endophytica]|nr:hypothetical protein [Stackebrandtia endophytica]